MSSRIHVFAIAVETYQKTAITRVDYAESRGRKEDDSLELEFRRVATRVAGFDIRFVDKKANLPGLQIADLVARPIGRHVINPAQKNRAYQILEPKFRRSPEGQINGYGLKIFP